MTGLLHRNLLSALHFPTASGTSTTSFKHTQGKAFQHRWSFLWQLSSASFFVLIVAEKITQSIRDVDISSIQFSRSVMSNSLWPHEPQCARPPCPSQTPGIYTNPCPLSRRCHPAISSSVVPFSSCLQSFPASGSFQMCQFFASGGQIIGVSASASFLSMNIQDWFPLGWTG